jgi:CHAT domain-containing protein
VVALKNALRIILVFAFAHVLPVQAQIDSKVVSDELTAAGKSLAEGHVKEGNNRIVALLRQIDPTKDAENYWRASTTLVEFLSQIEDHAQAGQVLNSIISTKIPDAVPIYKQWMQFYIGRNLAYSGNRDYGETFLRALTAGDARLVFIPAQRAAALMLSKIQLDRGNINQSAIWMRRAVVGTLVDKGAASEEIMDVLTEYAYFLTLTRQLSDAYNLFIKLSPLYEAQYSHHSPKYLRFLSYLIATLSDLGHFPAVDPVSKQLSDNVAAVDLVAPSVRTQLFWQDLYKLARTPPADGHAPILDRLKQIAASEPDFLKNPRNRIAFSYFALLAGDLELADQFNSGLPTTEQLDQQLASYEIVLKSVIAARRNQFDESITLSREAVDKIRLFHQRFEDESSDRLPAMTTEERLVLSLILGTNSPHVSSYEEAKSLFKLAQFLNRDKANLGVNQSVARQELTSDLQREDVRTRDRLKDLRDRLMDEAANSLLARVLPIRNYTQVRNTDFSYLSRLEDIEDKIANAEDRLRHSDTGAIEQGADSPIELNAIQKLIRPDEALVQHVFVGGIGLVTTCIDSNNATFNFKMFDKAELQQIVIDEKLLSAAVHRSDDASILDANFPTENSHRMYQFLFGGIEACLKNKTQILLATDPDLFALPWNALLIDAPPPDREFHLREASWLPRLYALSLLPSVRSLYQLRAILVRSQAQQKFLGIGDPDLGEGNSNSTQLVLGPLFSSRGVGDKAAITNLPRLPESADELRAVANALGASTGNLLLGPNATERALRQHPLNDYRVISFATHAVVAGEIEKVTEPALVLTPGEGEATNSQNDGLLTLSEIANLTLDANLVILSACNTAASDGHASGRGLSGLANAFFFAGARAVAVTQWAVFSKMAQQLGAGLILRSIKSRRVGISEGLREAMLAYIASAKEDYLANPRFWAAFIIAGDGAVRPLDGAAESPEVNNAINLEWEHLTDGADAEIRSIARSPDSLYIMGMERPPPNEKRAGSYLGGILPSGNMQVIARDGELAVLGLVSIGSEIGSLGYFSEDKKSSAVFRLLNKDGQRQWQHVERGSLSNFPVSMIRTANGYILISIENDYSAHPQPSTLIFTLVSERGDTLKQRRYTLSVNPSVWWKNTALNAERNLVVAVGGYMPASSSSVWESRMWTNPQTGTKRFCFGTPNESEVFEIDTGSLDVIARKIIQNVSIVSLKFNDGHLYAASNVVINCEFNKGVNFGELDSDFELKTIFQSNYVNSLEVRDFEITSDGVILLAGTTRTFLPTAVTATKFSLEEIKNFVDMWDESTWEKTELRGIGFILALSKDGIILGDRVFPDLRNRSFHAVLVTEKPDRLIAVGSAFGDRGWIAGLRLGGQLKRTAGAPVVGVP